MCGIVGYVGKQEAKEIIFSGLKSLEYRGYDSAGIALIDKNRTKLVKKAGKLEKLKPELKKLNGGTMGIGHTRWATHGEPNRINSHPHRSGGITIVHNGIIENHGKLRTNLRSTKFHSETDSEVFAHILNKARASGKSLFQAVRASITKLKGNSAFVVMDEDTPETIIAVRTGASPLVVGLGEEEAIVASDVPALLKYTRDVYYLQEKEIAVLHKNKVEIFDFQGKKIQANYEHITWDIESIDKMGYEHFMLKEIFEQEQAIADTLAPWLQSENGQFQIHADGMNEKEIVRLFKKAKNIHISACGTAFYCALYAQSFFEKHVGISTRASLASEFRYGDPVIHKNDIGIVISQSGETADTLAALKLMKSKGMKTFAVCNVRGSSIARECDGVFHTNAGIEICVASTKALITQLALFAVLGSALKFRLSDPAPRKEKQSLQEFRKLPKLIRGLLDQSTAYKKLALKYDNKKGYLYLGRGIYFPMAMEGALKLKEIAYVHAEGYPAGELKHGPIALVDPEMLVVAIAPEAKGLIHEKTVSNVEEVRARKGVLLGLGASEDSEFRNICSEYIEIPRIKLSELYPILCLVPLQFFAYFVAQKKGLEIDQPRNLAKSVTVE